MATVSSTSLLSRTRSGRLPNGKFVASHDAVTVSHAPIASAIMTTSTSSTSTPATIPAAPSFSHILTPASNVAIFLTNLHLLNLDLLPDWPNISARTFAVKDAVSQSGQKRRIQSVEWALYHLFCLWDPNEARTTMQPLFPPADQVQSVSLRAAFLRGLEAAKKSSALGRDAILRKTMLDECRGERFEEILAVFSSAVLKSVVEREDETPKTIARKIALETRGYSADRTQLYALILAHNTSLHQILRQKAAARARYHEFEELLALKEQSLAQRQELTMAHEDVADNNKELNDIKKVWLQRLVRNNWSGSEAWMQTLLYGDERISKDGLLSAPPDRVWRRVQAGRVGELESRTGNGLLDQLDRRLTAQRERLNQWREYSQHVLRRQPQTASCTTTQSASQLSETRGLEKTGIDLGFDAHKCLSPAVCPSNDASEQQQQAVTDILEFSHDDEYAAILKTFHDDLANLHQPRRNTSGTALFLQNTQKAASGSKMSERASLAATSEDGNGDVESDISDMEEHPIVVQQRRQLSAPPSDDGESPTRRRVLLTKSSMTFSVKSYHSDDEPLPQCESLSPKLQRATTVPIDQPLSPVVRNLLGQKKSTLALRRRQQSPPIRPPRAVTAPPPAPRTPSPDRSPPPPSPPSDDDGLFELMSTPQHSVTLQPPPAFDDASSTGTSPTQDLADQILASMSNASPSPIKRPRHTLSLAERTRMSIARASRVGRGPHYMASEDEDEWLHDDENASVARHPDTLLAPRRQPNVKAPALCDKGDRSLKITVEDQAGANAAEDPDGLIARTRKSMAGFEAARQKAQLDRKRLLKKSRQSSLGVASASTTTTHREAATGGYFSPVNEADGDDDDEPGDTTLLAEELMSGGQDDAEAIFRSRPRIKMSPIPSPTRELEYD
ncbi:hypothetical protein SEPCBS57363_002076 [Sporothrix epigloea]|uniref:HAUS augmin-like complex subunit 6 N-terminal domain-containing protein n=1 Tax=Sporothrix epigloea TaxID=1892477 RepID=A0ABP0DF33_9PEZI